MRELFSFYADPFVVVRLQHFLLPLNAISVFGQSKIILRILMRTLNGIKAKTLDCIFKFIPSHCLFSLKSGTGRGHAGLNFRTECLPTVKT